MSSSKKDIKSHTSTPHSQLSGDEEEVCMINEQQVAEVVDRIETMFTAHKDNKVMQDYKDALLQLAHEGLLHE